MLIQGARTKWNKKRVFMLIAGIIFVYTFLTSGFHKYQIDTHIKNANAHEIWEYVADFSKMRYLNPTILDFSITADHGNPEHWKYSVNYREKLSHWPNLEHNSNGHYSVYRLKKQNELEEFIVESEHKTCFFLGLYCLKSTGEFKCYQTGVMDSYCIETVYYQCAPFFKSFCKREVEYQRKIIMKNLTNQFAKNKL